MQTRSPRDLIRAAYLLGVQEGAQAAVEKVCDDFERRLPPDVRDELWNHRQQFGAELHDAARAIIEEEGMPEELASTPERVR